MLVEIIYSFFELFSLFFLIILPFCYDLSSKFRYYFRLSVYYILLFFGFTLLFPASLLFYKKHRNAPLVSKIFKSISPVLNVKCAINGEVHLQSNDAYILVTRYRHSLDILGIFELWPYVQKCTIVLVKRDVALATLLTLSSWVCGSFKSVNNGKHAGKSNSIEYVLQAKTQKENLWIILNGDANDTEYTVQSCQHVLSKAVKEDVPVIPVVFSDYYFLNDTNKIFESGNIKMRVLNPILPGDTNVVHDENGKDTADGILQIISKATKDVTLSTTPPSIEYLRECYLHGPTQAVIT